MWLNERRHQEGAPLARATVEAVDATNIVPPGFVLYKAWLEPATTTGPSYLADASLGGNTGSGTKINEVQIYLHPQTGQSFRLTVPSGSTR
jgi:hypothetical protein